MMKQNLKATVAAWPAAGENWRALAACRQERYPERKNAWHSKLIAETQGEVA
jgi:hypothetical protein